MHRIISVTKKSYKNMLLEHVHVIKHNNYNILINWSVFETLKSSLPFSKACHFRGYKQQSLTFGAIIFWSFELSEFIFRLLCFIYHCKKLINTSTLS